MRNTVEFLAVWEELHNPDFNRVQFEAVRSEAGLNRALSKVNYRIHTDAVKENLIPPELTPEQIAYTYASEADLLNVALFGQTAKQWKNNNPYNAILIEQGKPQSERLILLRNLAIKQMDTLSSINLSEVSTLPGSTENQNENSL